MFYHSDVNTGSVCTDSEKIELHNSYTREVGGNILTTGIPRGCSGGAYTVLCNDKYIQPSYASYLCRAAGYEGNECITIIILL